MTTEVLLRLENLLDKVRNPVTPYMETVSSILMFIILVAGLLNVFLGFRLMRFWMVLGSMAVGLVAGVAGGWWMDFTKSTMLGMGIALGLVLAVLSFFVYNWGIFVLGLGIGCTLSVYVIHPTSSLTFFLCVLLGIGVGILGMKFSREIIILGTSVLGGLMAGLALSEIGGLSRSEGPLGIPYGLLFAFAIAVLGVLIQFATNQKTEDEEEEETEDSRNQDFSHGGGTIHRDEFGRKYRE